MEQEGKEYYNEYKLKFEVVYFHGENGMEKNMIKVKIKFKNIKME